MTSLFVRIKGRVQGPFDFAKLQIMASRGQLSRIHQVSEDREIWKKAGEFPQLFQAAQKQEQPIASQAKTTPEPVYSDAQPLTENASWYVEENGQPKGPMTFSELQQTFRTGRSEPENLVWQEGMDEWVPASNVDGLVSITAVIGRLATNQIQTSVSVDLAVDKQTVSILAGSRGWVIFCGVIVAIWAAMLFVIGYVLLMGGAKTDSASIVVMAISVFVMALLTSVAAYLLFSFSSAILRLRISPSVNELNSCLKRLNRIWLYIGGVLIVGIFYWLMLFIVGTAVDGNTSYLFGV